VKNNTYYTHWNGGRPYKVVVDEKNNEVTIYRWKERVFVGDEDYKDKTETNETNEDDEEDGDEDWEDVYNVEGKKYKYEKLFIGKSPLNNMTKYSGGYGDEFDGNVVLLKVSKNEYYYISKNVKSFTSENEITKLIAQVGNNDVPYPYCIDDKNNILLLDDSVIIKHTNNLAEDVEPYRYYYDNLGEIEIQTSSLKMSIIYGDDDD